MEFDYEHLKSVKMRGQETQSIVAREVDYNEARNINYAIGFIENEKQEITSTYIISLNQISDNIKEVKYYNIKGNLIVGVKLNKLTEKVTISSPNRNKKEINISGCGQDVQDCISDTYQNHGWISVGLWVTTLIQPEVGIGVAGLCTYDECIAK